ncbi:MAG: O-antigen ligase family protein [Marinosulfonomonas sp.]|nr:O-antigen ligase family protein [Marinosulfonomonas sp.]
MTPSIATVGSAHSSPRRLKDKASSMVALFASYDLMLATLIIIAGSQGVYRFAPPLLLWVMIYAMVGLKIATNLRSLLSVVRDNLTIFAFPAIAFVSATWSLVPSHTAYSAVQLTVTYFAGIWIGWRYRPRDIALVIVLGLSPLIALSLVNWATGMFGEAFSYGGGLLGVFGNKNTLGRMSLMLAISVLGLIASRRSRLSRDVVLWSLFGLAGFALLLSKSATSMLFLLGTTGLFIALTIHRYRASFRLVLGTVGVTAVLSGIAIMAFSSFDPVAAVLDVFGKSSNLTGRTFLWEVAIQQINGQPWLGVGFDAYWDSEGFLALDRIQQIYGSGLISFHNFVLDIWVGMGVPGLVAIAITIGTIAVVYLRYFLVSKSVESALMIAVFTLAIGVAMFNPLLHGQHGNMIVILIAFAVSARIEMRRKIMPD